MYYIEVVGIHMHKRTVSLIFTMLIYMWHCAVFFFRFGLSRGDRCRVAQGVERAYSTVLFGLSGG